MMEPISRNPRILWRDEDEALADAYLGLDGGNDVADIATSILYADGEVVALNVLGTEIWKLCDGQRNIDGIVSALLERFEVEEHVLRDDVAAFLAELKAKGFIRHE